MDRTLPIRETALERVHFNLFHFEAVEIQIDLRTISAPPLLGGFLTCYERETERREA
jgi:hypothetical protein